MTVTVKYTATSYVSVEKAGLMVSATVVTTTRAVCPVCKSTVQAVDRGTAKHHQCQRIATRK